jgi:peptidoglycan/LPS O-acetylase OafA/YrhL
MNYLSQKLNSRGSALKYRSDIDGLRTIAVFIVILNHAGFSFFSGGFVGVDVFFVLSGFLITSIIYPKIIDKNFSLGWFFSRRIKRLMPVLFCVIAVTAMVFTVVMLPQDLIKFYRSIIWVLLYGANFFMWINHGGYFNGNSQEVPLLHTWSLAVEEQYYFVWPVMLILAIRFCGIKVTAWLSLLLLVALTVLSQWGTDVTVGAAYYLLPTRFFELLIGSCLAIFWQQMPSLNRVMEHSLSIVGLGLILVSSLILNEHSSFPGYNALYPVIGTALIIYSQNGFINKLLSTKFMVYSGNISYSLYLWHWPIFTLMRYTSTELTLPVQILCILLTYVLSMLSYHYVEQPFRNIKLNEFKPIAMKLYIIPTSFLILFSLIGIYSKGYEGRFSSEVVSMDKSLNTHSSKSRKECHSSFRHYDKNPDSSCVLGVKSEENVKKGVFVFGDSHANHLVPFIDELIINAGAWGQDYTLDRCLPIAGLNWGGSLYKAKKCKERNDKAIQHIKDNKFKYVVLAASWPTIATRRMFNDVERITNDLAKELLFEQQLISTIGLIVEQGAVPILFEDTPTLAGKSPKCPIKQQVFDSSLDCGIHLEDNAFISSMFHNVKKSVPQAIIIKPSDLFCQGNDCQMKLDNTPLYRDNDHLNEDGARVLALRYLAVKGNFIK